MRRFTRLWHTLWRYADEALPLPPDQREQADRSLFGSSELDRRRREQFEIGLYRKNGKGGFR